jgi:hypothetical protein
MKERFVQHGILSVPAGIEGAKHHLHKLLLFYVPYLLLVLEKELPLLKLV